MTTYSILCAAPSPDGRVQCTNGKGHAGNHASMLGFLRWSDSEAPHGSYTRHGSPDYADGGMAAAAIEEEAEGDLWAKATPGQGSSEWWMARWQEAADRANACGLAAHMWKETAREHVRRVRTARGYIEALQGGIDMERARAEKAEQERDEARADAASLSRQLHDAQQDADMSRTEMEAERRPLDSEVADEEWLDARYEAALDQVGGDKATHLDPMTIFMIGAKWDRQYVEPRPLTAREHLDAAWEAAHVPEGGIIPAGAAYLVRSTRTGRVVTPAGDWAAPVDLPASESWGERRLLDPPAPSRPDGAEEIEAYMREMVASHSEDHYGELADHLASRGVRVVTEEER